MCRCTLAVPAEKKSFPRRKNHASRLLLTKKQRDTVKVANKWHHRPHYLVNSMNIVCTYHQVRSR